MTIKPKLLLLTAVSLILSGCAETCVYQLPTPPADVMQAPETDMLQEMDYLLEPFTTTPEKPSNTGSSS